MIILSALFIFVLTAVISFGGSVQLGPVNITVIRAAIAKNYTSAIFIGLGGALPELIYAGIAIKGAEFLERFPMVLNGLFLVCIPLFILIGLYFVFFQSKKDQTISDEEVEAQKKQAPRSIFKSILLGFSIGMINPMLLPFWMVVLSTYHSYELMLLPTGLHHLAFIIGTGFGAFLLQYLLVVLLRKYSASFEQKIKKYANPVTGWMFVVLGIIQLINYLNS